MTTIYCLAIVNLRHIGFNAEDVEVFTEVGKATERMRELYLKACEDCKIENPYEEPSGTMLTLEHQFVEDCYAYVFGEYYFDIFKKEVEL